MSNETNRYGGADIDDNEGLPDTHPVYDDAIDMGFGERAAWHYGDRDEHDCADWDVNHECSEWDEDDDHETP